MFGSFINIDKTIQRGRLAYKLTWKVFFAYLFGSVLGLMLTFGACAVGFNTKNHVSIAGAILISLFALWMLLNFFLLNIVVAVEGKSNAETRSAMCAVLNSYFDDAEIKDNAANIIRSKRPAKWFNLGRVITVILKEDKLYINIINLDGRGGVVVFYGLFNYLKCRRIARDFQNRGL